jgi:hypothetical protein
MPTHYVVTDVTGKPIAYLPAKTLPYAIDEARQIAESRSVVVQLYSLKALWLIPPSGEMRSIQELVLPVLDGGDR